VLSACPEPAGFGELPLRFGAHNLHENQPGSYRSERLVFVSYFSAGVRVYDLADPVHPVEVAHWLPEAPEGQPVPQINDLFVDDTGRSHGAGSGAEVTQIPGRTLLVCNRL
jgi:hypothetical protein